MTVTHKRLLTGCLAVALLGTALLVSLPPVRAQQGFPDLVAGLKSIKRPRFSRWMASALLAGSSGPGGASSGTCNER